MPASEFEREVIDGIASLKALQSGTKEAVDRIEYVLNGNGTPGLIKDVDRLKRADEARVITNGRQWTLIWILVTAVVGVCVTAAWNGITNKQPPPATQPAMADVR